MITDAEYSKLVRHKDFIAGLKNDAEAEVRRLENIIVDLDVFLIGAVSEGYDEATVVAVRKILEDEDE